MKELNLLLPDGTPSRVWACDECKLVAADERRARVCCTPIPCKYCDQPTEKKFRHGFESAHHDACSKAHYAKREAERIERAQKLADFDSWVWVDGYGSKDGYFESVEALVEYLEDDERDPALWPEWAYATKAIPVSLDVSDIIENLCDNGYEDMADDLQGVDELTAAVNAFNAANAGVVSYEVDGKRVVKVPRPAPTESVT